MVVNVVLHLDGKVVIALLQHVGHLSELGHHQPARLELAAARHAVAAALASDVLCDLLKIQGFIRKADRGGRADSVRLGNIFRA